jgi:steroid delta-isomerase-like uncharacterized protein
MLAENRKITERSTNLWNTGNLSIADEIFTTGYTHHDPARPDVRDLKDLKEWLVEVRASLPDLHVTIEDVVAEGDKVVTRWFSTGTNLGEYGGIPPTGKKATWTGMTITRFEAGKMAESWWNYDSLGLMQQLGLIPAMQGSQS